MYRHGGGGGGGKESGIGVYPGAIMVYCVDSSEDVHCI